MPIKKSAMKSLRQTAKRTARNKQVKDSIAYVRRQLRKALEAKDLKKAKGLAQDAVKKIDKAVQNGVLKANTGSRMKSRLMLALNRASKK